MGAVTVLPSGTDTIGGAASVALGAGTGDTASFTAQDLTEFALDWGWGVRLSGPQVNLPAWFGQSIPDGRVVGMETGAPAWIESAAGPGNTINVTENTKKRSHQHGGKRKRKRHTKGEVAFSVSMAEWRDMSGNKKTQLQRQRWLKFDRTYVRDKATSLHVVLGATPSAKVATVAAMTQHISYVLAALGRILAHNIDRPTARATHHFQAYIQRTAALDDLCHRLSGGRGMDAVVVLARRNAPADLDTFQVQSRN